MGSVLDIFEYAYASRALIASGIVGITCGVLGCFIVLRKMSLIGDALSHAILPGVVVGFMVAGFSVVGFFTGSVLAGLLTAFFITVIQRNVKTHDDAAIGIVFTSMFAVGVIGISALTRQEGVHLDLTDFLLGQILGISDEDLWMTFLVMVFTIICVMVFYRYFFITTFESVVAKTIGISVSTIHYFLMLLLSFAVVAALRSVGVILVVAMLITPASTAYLLTDRLARMLVIAALVGLLSTTLGLLIAIYFETTPGPAMTITATGFYILAVLFSPKRGLVSKARKRQTQRNRILREDVLKQAVRLNEEGSIRIQSIARKLQLSDRKLRQLVKALSRKGDLEYIGDKVKLTEKGLENGYRLVRAHRLWETYLVNELGLSEDQIHENAEKYEHILSEAILDEVAEHLGHPEQDPHGSPIPPKNSSDLPSLASMMKGQKARISLRQPNHLVRSGLWEMGLFPGLEVKITDRNASDIQLSWSDQETKIEHRLAEKIRVELSAYSIASENGKSD
ncbi:MAG: iron chelate uptake ABC transporter family permease subunit [Bacteroidota bacterium]